MQDTFIITSCLWHQLLLMFYKTFTMTIFLSLKSSKVFFFMQLLTGHLETFFQMKMGGGQMSKRMHAMEGCSNNTCILRCELFRN